MRSFELGCKGSWRLGISEAGNRAAREYANKNRMTQELVNRENYGEYRIGQEKNPPDCTANRS